MPTLDPAVLAAYRDRTFHSLDGKKVADLEQAVRYIERRGFIFFWPNKEVLCPSLWAAVAGDRPVADAHDDPGHVTWGWKDSLLDKKRVFYARVIRRRNTFISFDLLPSFYALSPNYGSPEEDYLIDYEAGRLTAEAKAVYEALLNNGPLDTIALRKAAHLTSRASDGPFNKALEVLQIHLRILPVGVSQAGAWKYAFIYDLVTRHYPWILERAHPIGEWDARRNILSAYLNSVGAARAADIARLTGWPAAHVERAAKKLLESAELLSVALEESPGAYLALPELLR